MKDKKGLKMKITARLSFLLFLLVTTSISLASFDDAVEHYEDGDYKQAFMEFQSLAEIGHKEAQFKLGLMFKEGAGTDKDLVKAYGWIKLSDENTQTKLELIDQVYQQLNNQQQAEAVSFYASLNETLNEEALKVALEPIYKNTDRRSEAEIRREDPKILKSVAPLYPREASYKGVEGWVTFSYQVDGEGSPVEINVVDSYPGNVFIRNTLKAVKRWKFKLPSGDKPYQEVYKFKLEFTLSEPTQSNKRLLAEIKEKAEAGHPDAQYRYAKFKDKVDYEPEFNPTEWLYKAARQGHLQAQYEVADSLLFGDGCEADKEKAINWLVKSASGNLASSQLRLAKLFFELEEQERGYFWLDKAISSQDPASAYNLAAFLYNLDDERYPLVSIISFLSSVDHEKVQYPIRFYELLAKLYFESGDFSNAVSYQKMAHKALRRVNKVPEGMQAKLHKYQEALEGSNS
ncbi:MAG: TonB family protein [Kangiella sp.]|jgi:TonB family protein|nr:TonB family protein [Kangiella sp.]